MCWPHTRFRDDNRHHDGYTALQLASPLQENQMNRRQFIGRSGASFLTAPAFSQTRSANDTIQVGIVGPGGRGTTLLRECIEFGSKYNARLVAACDIWKERRDAAGKRLREAYGSEPVLYDRL